MQLYPHQQLALERMANGKILYGGVGSGKTATGLAYYTKEEAPKPLYVITTAKKRDDGDWAEEGRQMGVEALTVDSWNNIDKYIDTEDAFFIFDEQRLVGSGMWTKAYLKIVKKNKWIMLSATPGDTWMDFIPVFIANGFYKNRTEFKREHVVYAAWSKFPKVERYMGVGRLVRQRNEILVPMAFRRHTTRHLKTISVDYDLTVYNDVRKTRWHLYEGRPTNNPPELVSVIRRVVYSNPSRLAKIVELLQKHPKLIVFYNFDYELDILRGLQREESEWTKSANPSTTNPVSTSASGSTSLSTPARSSRDASTVAQGSQSGSSPLELGSTTSTLPSGPASDFAVAEWNGHKHQPIPKTDSWVYLVQYAAGAEGWNCVETDAMVFYSLTYSYKNFEQAQGRIDRLNTKFNDLWYYILQSQAPIDGSVRQSLREKRNFNQSRFIEQSGMN